MDFKVEPEIPKRKRVIPQKFQVFGLESAPVGILHRNTDSGDYLYWHQNFFGNFTAATLRNIADAVDKANAALKAGLL